MEVIKYIFTKYISGNIPYHLSTKIVLSSFGTEKCRIDWWFIKWSRRASEYLGTSSKVDGQYQEKMCGLLTEGILQFTDISAARFICSWL